MSYTHTKKLAGNLDINLSSAIHSMQSNGLHFDFDEHSVLLNEMETDLERLRLEFYYEFGVEFKSSNKLFESLFKESDFNKIINKTKKGKPSYKEEQFLELKDERIKKLVLDLNACHFFRSNYTTSFTKYVKDGIIYPKFYQQKSLRLGMSQPNLSGLPTNAKYDIRKCLKPHKHGYVFLNIDYQAQELALQADLSGDASLINLIREGLDLHTFIQELAGLPTRRLAKNFNFANTYGAGIAKLAEILDMTVEKVRGIKKALDIKMPASAQFRVRQQSFAKRHNAVINGKGVLVACERYSDALNYTIQSTAASIMREALGRVDTELRDKFKKLDVNLIMQIYDSIVLSLPQECVAEIEKDVSDIMIDSYTPHNGLPMSVDAKIYKTNLSENDERN